MPNIADHQSTETIKLLLIGHSGAGKSGALCSLAAAGYKLRIVDLDNGLDVVRSYLTDPASPYVRANPGVASRTQFVTITEKMKVFAETGRAYPIKGDAWKRVLQALSSWPEEGPDKGKKIQDFDSDTIFVLDSLSKLGDYAKNYHLLLQGALMKTRTSFENQRDVGAAQGYLRDLLDLLYDVTVRCHVVMISHIKYTSDSGEGPKRGGEAGQPPGPQPTLRGFPNAVGAALSPHIPRYFNHTLIARTIGAGAGTKHTISTRAELDDDKVINAKSAVAAIAKPTYPIETGLAEYFALIRKPPAF